MPASDFSSAHQTRRATGRSLAEFNLEREHLDGRKRGSGVIVGNDGRLK